MTKSELIKRLRTGGRTGERLLVFPKSFLDEPGALHAETIAESLQVWLKDDEEIHYGLECGRGDWTWYFVTDRGLLELKSVERDGQTTTTYRFRPACSLVSIDVEDVYRMPHGLRQHLQSVTASLRFGAADEVTISSGADIPPTAESVRLFVQAIEAIRSRKGGS